MDEEMTFTVIDDDGEETECEVLLTFSNEETGLDYIVYTDNTYCEDGSINIFASTYNPDEEETMLLPIQTDEEWDVIEKIIEELQE